jgi:hypothetical protein
MADHTPGPWKVLPKSSHLSIMEGDEWSAVPICDVYIASRPDEGKANARLIAAAPTMYDLLHEIRHRVPAGSETHGLIAAVLDEIDNGAP